MIANVFYYYYFCHMNKKVNSKLGYIVSPTVAVLSLHSFENSADLLIFRDQLA